MDEMQIRGLALMAAAALGVMLVTLWGRPRAIWYFALALLVVGLGYLATTPAPTEIAQWILGASAAPTPAAQ